MAPAVRFLTPAGGDQSIKGDWLTGLDLLHQQEDAEGTI